MQAGGFATWGTLEWIGLLTAVVTLLGTLLASIASTVLTIRGNKASADRGAVRDALVQEIHTTVGAPSVASEAVKEAISSGATAAPAASKRGAPAGVPGLKP